MSLTRGLVLDVINQVGGAAPGAAVLHDWSRYRSDGTITTAAYQQLASTGLWVLDFNLATPDYVEIATADCPQLNFTAGDFSIIARVNFDNLAGLNAIFCRGLSNADGYYFFVFNWGGLAFRTAQAAATQQSFSLGALIVTGNWYTLGVSRVGTVASMFIDGIDVSNTLGVHIDPLTCARSAKIGIYDDLNTLRFDGRMAFLKIYNFALSPAQHRAIHHKRRYLFGDPT